MLSILCPEDRLHEESLDFSDLFEGELPELTDSEDEDVDPNDGSIPHANAAHAITLTELTPTVSASLAI